MSAAKTLKAAEIDRIRSMASKAAEVLDNEAFRAVEDQIKRRLLNDMVDTKGRPEQRHQMRDDIAAEVKALRRILDGLQTMRDAGKRLDRDTSHIV